VTAGRARQGSSLNSGSARVNHAANAVGRYLADEVPRGAYLLYFSNVRILMTHHRP
jgi:hypothetical protein